MAGSVSRSDEGTTISSLKWYVKIDTFSFLKKGSTLFAKKVYPFCEKGRPFFIKTLTLFVGKVSFKKSKKGMCLFGHIPFLYPYSDYFNACSISAMISSTFSIPTERRIKSGATPASRSCSSVN